MTRKSSTRHPRRAWGIALSDLHAGYPFAPLHPETVLPALDDRGEQIENEYVQPTRTATAKMLYDMMEADRKKCFDMIGEEPAFLLFEGDARHGRPTTVSPRVTDHDIIAVDLLRPWLAPPNVEWARFIKGTEYHVGKYGQGELAIARALASDLRKDIKAYHHVELHAYGVILDVAHKGAAAGSRAWLRGNELRYYVKSIQDNYLKVGKPPPDAVLRGHYHDRTIVHVENPTWDRTWWTWGAIVPAYSLHMDDWTRHATRSKDHMTVGVLLIEIVDGRIAMIHDFTHDIDIRRREVRR